MRDAFLESHAQAIGDAWVEQVRTELRRDDRDAAGGWPGTLSEARAHTSAHFARGELTGAELEVAAHAVYGRARSQWLAHARTDD